MNCILCGSNVTSKLSKVYCNDLRKLYKKQLNISYDLYNELKSIDLVRCNKCYLEFYYPLLIGDQKFYSDLACHDWYYQKNKEEYIFAANFIDEGSLVLDVGCGEGNFGKLLNKCNYTGLEPNIESGRVINNSFKILNVFIDGHSDEFPNYYDYVTLFQVLEHVADPSNIINKSIKALKNNGFLIISVPNNLSYIYNAQNAVLNYPPHHVIRWNKNSLSYLSNIFQVKSKIISELLLDPIHYSNYQTIIGQKIFKSMMSISNKEIDTSFSTKVINKISTPVGKILGTLLNKSILQPIGHSIIAIYEKY